MQDTEDGRAATPRKQFGPEVFESASGSDTGDVARLATPRESPHRGKGFPRELAGPTGPYKFSSY